MTDMQRRFANEYMMCGNANEAAIKAGYSENYARSQGYKLLHKPGVRDYMRQMNNRMKSDKIADMSEINEFWTKIIRDEGIDLKDRMKAAEFRAKVQGAFVDKGEVDDSKGGNVQVVFEIPRHSRERK